MGIYLEIELSIIMISLKGNCIFADDVAQGEYADGKQGQSLRDPTDDNGTLI